MIDSHCHLADEAFSADLEDVIARAKHAGVERTLVILAAGNPQESRQAQRVSALWPETRVSVGVHPHTAHEWSDDPGGVVDRVREQIASTPTVRAVGEIGLDYHYDFSPPHIQQEVFRAQVRLARELELPIVIHTREADEDTLAILKSEAPDAIRGVLHCFTGDDRLAEAGLEIGLHLSLAGILTFPNATRLRDVVRAVPLNRLLTETDSPFLAPVPHRGKRNEPAFVAKVVEALAELHGLTPTELAEQTAANFHALFRP